MKGYYTFLKEELDNYEGDFDKYILYVIDYFKLLCKLLDEKIPKEDKLKINSALAYFVVPNDVIPEDIYGPAGYIDDVFVCSIVLMELAEKHGLKLLKKYWESDEDLEKVLKITYKKSLKELTQQKLIEKISEQTGLEIKK